MGGTNDTQISGFLSLEAFRNSFGIGPNEKTKLNKRRGHAEGFSQGNKANARH